MLQLEEVYGFWPVSFWSTWLGIIIIILAIISILCLFYIIFLLFLKKKRSIWQIFLEKLKRIQKQVENDLGQFDNQFKFYEQSTKIFKELLATQDTILFKKIDPGLTDLEIIAVLKRTEEKNLNEKLQINGKLHVLTDLFIHAQNVKFANKTLKSDILLKDKENLIKILNFLKPDQNLKK